MDREREELEKRMVELVGDYRVRCDMEKVVVILDVACNDGRAGRAVERM